MILYFTPSAVVCVQMTSVERVVEYTELESEAPWETKKKPPPDWPSKGLVTFDGVSFSYSPESPVVLHKLKAMFRPKEKVSLTMFKCCSTFNVLCVCYSVQMQRVHCSLNNSVKNVLNINTS